MAPVRGIDALYDLTAEGWTAGYDSARMVIGVTQIDRTCESTTSARNEPSTPSVVMSLTSVTQCASAQAGRHVLHHA
jgi:hypothetical protein